MAEDNRGNAVRTGTPGSAVSDALQRLQAGEIEIHEYLEFQADGAVEHLKGVLPKARLDVVRAVVLEQLRTDPVVMQEIRQLTGYDLEAERHPSGT